ncbi:MAG: hypothetical protein JXB88_22705 [Spirochaetales bacterium]|nr:hypothetical protein [Spirochaetales bacterium]
MDTNSRELKTYILEDILTLFIKGDYLFYIKFAGTSEILYADEITGEESIRDFAILFRREHRI